MGVVAMSRAVRRLAVWVPDWPVVAALHESGTSMDAPAVVVRGHRVVAASASARAVGVQRGMRQRRAQRMCPELVCFADSPGRDAREFEAVAAAVEGVVAGVEITRPGLIMVSAAGAARFHGDELTVAEAVVSAVAVNSGYESHAGIADGLLGALLAARSSSIVPPEATREFLDPQPLECVEYAAHDRAHHQQVTQLVAMAHRLGLRTVGQWTQLPRGDVSARFGQVGVWAWHLGRGEDLQPPVAREHQHQVSADYTWEEPVLTMEPLLVAAAQVAGDLEARLGEVGARCSKVKIVAVCSTGEVLERVWRTDVARRPGAFVPHMTDRVRWQLEGWLSGTSHGPEAAPLSSLHLEALDVVAIGAEHQYLWGADSGADGVAARTVARVQGMVGLEGVLSVREQGGRTPQDRVSAQPWGEVSPVRDPTLPWPGQIPDPPPATVLGVPEPLMVVDAGGRQVNVTPRLAVSAPPTWVRRHRPGGQGWAAALPVAAWAGPWPVIEHWWSQQQRRRVYLQLAFADAPAVLVSFGEGRWQVEAIYD